MKCADKQPPRDSATFDAVVLAGERSRHSELLDYFHVPAKSFIKVAGQPMIARVISALFDSKCVERVFLCGENQTLFRDIPLIDNLMKANRIIWVQNEKGPSLSSYKAMKRAGGKRPILLTTSDHALLTSEHVGFFCKKALSKDTDLAVGLARVESLAKYPQVKRTSYRFRDGRFCSCNLFGFLNTASFKAARFWVGLEEKRKNPLKVIMGFGLTWAVRYLLGILSLEMALKRASEVLGCKVDAVIMPYGEAAIDVDTLKDWQLVQKIASASASVSNSV